MMLVVLGLYLFNIRFTKNLQILTKRVIHILHFGLNVLNSFNVGCKLC